MNLEELRSDLDAAKRICDAVNLHLTVDYWNAIGKWIACNLSDGRSDGILYDTKGEAVSFQFDEFRCLYLQIQPDGITEKAALSFLRSHRKFYDAGMRLSDPDLVFMPRLR